MKTILKAVLSVAVAIGAAPSGAAVTTFEAKRVVSLHSDAERPCVIFRLEGVAESDSAMPGVPWFALLKTHPSYNELVAFLATAKAANLPITVHTSGVQDWSCSGFVTVNILGID